VIIIGSTTGQTYGKPGRWLDLSFNKLTTLQVKPTGSLAGGWI
jgi:hypothetical protein